MFKAGQSSPSAAGAPGAGVAVLFASTASEPFGGTKERLLAFAVGTQRRQEELSVGSFCHASGSRETAIQQHFSKININLKFLNLLSGHLCEYVRLSWKYTDLELTFT